MDIAVGGRGHLATLHLADTRPCGIEDEDVDRMPSPRNASIAADPVSPRGRADDCDFVSPIAASAPPLEQLTDQLHGEVFERQRRAVEQLEQEMVRPNCTSGARAVCPKPSIGPRDTAAEFIPR